MNPIPRSREPDDAALWRRRFRHMCLFAAFVHSLQFLSGGLLWTRAGSPILLVFGLDAAVGAVREVAMAVRAARSPERAAWGRSRAAIAAGYLLVGSAAMVLGAAFLWRRQAPAPSLLGVGLAALSMLLIPIIGSYMKALAMELRDRELASSSVFTFGNSYLSMVLLIGLLVNAGMGYWWGDPLGAVVMCPFIAQKGIQVLSANRTGGVFES